MKRVALLFVLLMLLVIPALADVPEEALAAMRAVYPEAKVVSSAAEGDTAFFVLTTEDETVYCLCCFNDTNGMWVLTQASNTALLPAYKDGLWGGRRYYYTPELSLKDEQLSIRYDLWEDLTYVFRQEGADWRFDRLLTDDDVNDIHSVLTYSGGVVREECDNGHELLQSAPIPLPWLSHDLLLDCFDVQALPGSLWELTDVQREQIAAQLLPGYTYVGAAYAWGGAAFLMDDEAGQRFFIGGAYGEAGWVFTQSQPLPADTYYDSFHSRGDCFILYVDHPDGLIDEWGDEVFNEYVVCLQSDGRWLIETIFDSRDGYIHFAPGGVLHDMMGMYYGTYTGERDIARVDWASVPRSYNEVVALLAEDMGMVAADQAALRSEPAGDAAAAYTCFLGAPVRILAYDGEWVRVAVADGERQGWLRRDEIAIGDEQLTEYEDWALVTLQYLAPYAELREGALCYAEPDGRVLFVDRYGGYYQPIGEAGKGWLHLYCELDAEDFFVRTEDIVPEEE